MINFDPVENNLIVGSAPTSTNDVKRLSQQLKITAVINLQSNDDFSRHQIDWPTLQSEYERSDIALHRFPITDFDEMDLEKRVGEPIKMLNRLLQVGHRVYVHCNAGICRAPATIMGYLCIYKGMDEEQALAYLRERRPKANPYRKAIRTAIQALKDEASNSTS